MRRNLGSASSQPQNPARGGGGRAHVGDVHGIRRQLHLRWPLLTVVVCDRAEGRVFLDFVYLGVIWELCIAT